MSANLVTAAAAAARRRARLTAGAERVAASAGRYRVGVLDLEAPTHQRLGIVDDRAAEIHGANLVDKYADTIALNDFVAVLGLVLEGHAVGQTATAAALNEDAEAVLTETLCVQQGFNLL